MSVIKVPVSLRMDADETNSIANVAYNGFRFPPCRRSSVSFSPEMSDDGRTIKYYRMDLHIEFTWVPMHFLDSHISSPTGHGYDINATTDASFPSIKQRLITPGQPLRFQSQGLGSIRVQEGGFYDVNNGPKPRVVSERPIAGNAALDITWECSVWLPNCPSNFGIAGIAQFNYGVSWGIGVNGLTTRTISGSVEIPMSRTPNPSSTSPQTGLRKSADEIREQVSNFFPLVKAYQRTQSFSLSSDRKTLNFSIVDTEIGSENPFFPGVVNMSVRRSFNSDYKNGFTIWGGTVSGSFETAPGYSKLRAWIAFATVFLNIFNRRTLGHTPNTDSTAPTTPGSTSQTGKQSWGMLTSISLEEEVYGRNLSFSISYRLFCSLAELFKATGLFQPLNISESEASWDLWKTSMKDVQGPRGWQGTYGLKFFTTDDVIIDLCSGSGVIPNRNPETPPTSDSWEMSSQDGKKANEVPKDKSYIHAESSIEMSTHDGTSHAVPLQKSQPINESTSISNPINNEQTLFGINEGTSAVSKPVIARGRAAKYVVTFRGSLARVAYQPPIPNLKSVGGVKAFKIGTDRVFSKVLGTGTDVETGKPLTIYGVSWEKQYVLEDRPKTATIDSEGEIAMYT